MPSHNMGEHVTGMGIDGSGNGKEDVVVGDGRVHRREAFRASDTTFRMDRRAD